MHVNLTAPAIVAVVGALTYGLVNNGKLSEIGRLAFFAGLLTFLLGMR